MKIILLSVQPAKSDWLETALQEYSEKLGRFFKTELIFVKPSKRARGEALAKKKEESDALLLQIQSDDFVVVCDEKGLSPTSKQLAAQLEVWLRSGKKRLVFVIGGAYGHSEGILARSNYKLSLSPLTMNHLVAHVVLLEQIYRANTLLKNLPYHNE